MQIIKGTLLLGTLVEEPRPAQSTNVLVEDVFVLCVAGQCAMHSVTEAEKFLCVLIKSFVWSLGSFLQRVDCINHGGKGGEPHPQTLLEFDPRGGVTPSFQMSENGPASFQSGNATFSPTLIIGRIGSLLRSILDLADPLKEILTLPPIKMRDSVEPELQTCLSILAGNGRNSGPVRRSVFLQQAIELGLLLLNCSAKILIHVNQLLDGPLQHTVLMGRSSGCWSWRAQ